HRTGDRQGALRAEGHPEGRLAQEAEGNRLTDACSTRRPSGAASSLIPARPGELNRLQRREPGACAADTAGNAADDRPRAAEARCEEAARNARGLDEPITGVVEGDAPGHGPPVAAVGTRLGDVRKAVVVCVARSDAAVPALSHRLRIPAAVAPGEVDRRADRLAVEPHAPPGLPVRHLEHLEGVLLPRLDAGVQLD